MKKIGLILLLSLIFCSNANARFTVSSLDTKTELLLEDNEGKRTGYDFVRKEKISEIGDSTYIKDWSDGSQREFNSLDYNGGNCGIFGLTVYGVGDNRFMTEVRGWDGIRDFAVIMEGLIKEGEIQKFEILYSSGAEKPSGANKIVNIDVINNEIGYIKKYGLMDKDSIPEMEKYIQNIEKELANKNIEEAKSSLNELNKALDIEKKKVASILTGFLMEVDEIIENNKKQVGDSQLLEILIKRTLRENYVQDMLIYKLSQEVKYMANEFLSNGFPGDFKQRITAKIKQYEYLNINSTTLNLLLNAVNSNYSPDRIAKSIIGISDSLYYPAIPESINSESQDIIETIVGLNDQYINIIDRKYHQEQLAIPIEKRKIERIKNKISEIKKYSENESYKAINILIADTQILNNQIIDLTK